MSDHDNSSEFRVGRGKPPVERQFTKGRSGNPKGRPKKAVAPAAGDQDSLNEVILAEAGRLITLTEGGKPVTLSAAEAVLRALFVNAGKGNAHAQRTYLQLLLNAQAQRDKARSELLLKAYQWKIELEEAYRARVAEGRSEMSMAVHPSDIEINGQTGEVKLYVALTTEEREARARLRHILDGEQAILVRSIATVALEGDDPLLQLGREIAGEKIRRINEFLPSRFRRTPINPATFKIDPENIDHARWSRLAAMAPRAPTPHA
jgi:hypothetical protein